MAYKNRSSAAIFLASFLLICTNLIEFPSNKALALNDPV